VTAPSKILIAIGHHISINLKSDSKIISLIRDNKPLLARIIIMLLLEISQANSRIHALKSREINKTNLNKEKEKELSVIIIIN
jgi:hypothetical protein